MLFFAAGGHSICMKNILSSFLALTLLLGATSAAFASSKKSGHTASHKRSTTGKHRTTKQKTNVPKNAN
jgi:hypothetical protein